MPDPGAQRAGVASRDDAGLGMDAAEVGAGAGGYSSGQELAGALADALAGGDYAVGAVAEEDIAMDQEEASDAGDDQGSAMAERQALADRIAEIDAAIQGSEYASGFSPQDPYGTGGTPAVDDFSSGGYATPGNQAGGMETFGFNPQHQTSPAFLEGNVNVDTFSDMPASAPSPMTGPETFSDYNQGVAQGYNFDQTQQGHPDFQGVQSVGTGVEDFASMAGTPAQVDMGTGYADPNRVSPEMAATGMAAPTGQGGLISTGQYDATMGATAGAPVMSGPQEASADQQGGLISAGAPAGAPAGTDFFGDEDVGVATDSPAGTRMTEEGLNVYGKQQIDKSIMTVSATLDQKAKELLETHGWNSKEYQKAQRMANAFKSLDQYSKAYAATQGGSFVGSLISGAMPFAAAFKGIQGWLTKQGIYSKELGQDLLNTLEEAVKFGDFESVLRDMQGGGPSDEDVQGPKEIRSFIEKYPWAAELDPKYIQYLIDNPAELQDLLGQGPGGGDQAAPGGQAKPGGGGSSPPAGFTQKPGAATMALVEWSNPTTGETWTAPNGGWQGPEGWVIV